MAIKWKSIALDIAQYARTAFYFPAHKVKKIHVYIILVILMSVLFIVLIAFVYVKLFQRNHFNQTQLSNQHNCHPTDKHSILVCVVTKDLGFDLFRTVHELFYNSHQADRLQICICLHETERIKIMKSENMTAFDQADIITPFKHNKAKDIQQNHNLEQQFENMNYFKQCESILDQYFYKKFKMYLWLKSIPFSKFENKIKMLDQGFYNTHQARTIAQETAYSNQTFLLHCYSGFTPVLGWDKICINQWFEFCLQSDYDIHEKLHNQYKHVLTYQPNIKRYSERFRKKNVKQTLMNMSRTVLQKNRKQFYEDSSFACFEKDSVWNDKMLPEILYRKPANNFKRNPYSNLCCNTFFIFAFGNEWVKNWEDNIPSLGRLQTEEPEINLYDFFLTCHYVNKNFSFYSPGVEVFSYEYEEVKHSLPDYESYRFRFYSTLRKRDEKYTSIEKDFIKWIHQTYKNKKTMDYFRYDKSNSTFENYIFQGIVNSNDQQEIQLKYM